VDAGDCDVGDEKCLKDSVKIPTLAETEAADKEKADKKAEEKSEKKEEKKDQAAPADK